MNSETETIELDVPTRLLESAGVLSTALGTSRSGLLVAALEDYLEHVRDGALEQEIAAAYYDDEITFEELAAVVGRKRAADFRVLKRHLEDSVVDELAEP
ncbi:hypothetical protein [Natrinema longum]|uniref:Ribbon-helix-helix protein, copG family n=1 Tax=Natrinema longum TaxID=370324 RepID=A0A8A2UDA3_9EURY|nr:hypothetical protein [Natrinema longum]MBZ6495400.1 hypothetical protein [Natrinema longum]QSW86627.1 hypothetical protein J0X27_07375 [Natrinema longum]